MIITIFDRVGNPKADISPADSSTQATEIQGDNVLTLSFTHYDHIPLDVDDYVDFEGERYRLAEAYRPVQKSTGEWSYDIKLYGIQSLIRNFLVIKRVDGEDDPVFTLTAPPREHVAMIVDCMNDGAGSGSDWKVGTVTGAENIVIDYHGKYCDEALKEIAEKVGAEYWIEGQTVNVCRCEHGEPVTLGYDKGLTSINPDKADNVKFYTRLYPVGSSRNIDKEKYGFSRLQLPDRQKYVEINADKYGRVDHYEADAFAGIYPRRIGEVSSVRSEVKTGEDGNPFTIYYFRDNNLPFDPNDYEIGGMVKRVSFQEGSELGGLGQEDSGTYYFEVNYDSDTREFEIITIWPYDNDVQLPGGALVPKAGDKYILWNLRMPDEYYSLAEEELLTAVNKFNNDHGLDVTVVKAPTDHVWIEDNDVKLFIGRRVRLESEQYFPGIGYRDSRITKITRKVNLPSSMDIEIGDALSQTALQKMTDSISDARNYASGIAAGMNLPDLIRTGDRTRPTDNNIFSALRSRAEFMLRTAAEKVAHVWSFLKGIRIGEYVQGASGAAVDAAGNGEVESLTVRSWMKVYELIYNRLNSVEGNTAFADSGTIESIEYTTAEDGGKLCTATMRRRWEGDFTAFQKGDIVYGYVNRLDDSGSYYKAWAWVDSVDRAANTLTLKRYADADVPGGANFQMEPGMLIARWGNNVAATRENYADPELKGAVIEADGNGGWRNVRQDLFYISCNDGNIVQYMGVDSPIIRSGNLGTVLGRIPEGLLDPETEKLLNPHQPYLYARGVVVQDLIRIDYNGNEVSTPNFRGEWDALTAADPDCYYRNCGGLTDIVAHKGHLWQAVSARCSEEPSESSAQWMRITAEPSADYEIQPSVNTIYIRRDGYSTNLLECRVERRTWSEREVIGNPEELDSYGLELVYSLDGVDYSEFWVRDGSVIEGTGLMVGGNNVPWLEITDYITLTLRDKESKEVMTSLIVPVVKDGADGKGEPGKDGRDGGYTETRYKVVDGYPDSVAINDSAEKSPAGWSLTHGKVIYGSQSLWQTTARFDGAGKLLGTWSDPVMLTGRPGDVGAMGKTGPIAYPAGVFDRLVTYVSTSTCCPVVQDGADGNGMEQYYLLKPGMTYCGDTETERPKTPHEDAAKGGVDSKWERADRFRMIFADIVMANLAKLGAAVFYGSSMISQYGTDIFGNAVTEEGGYRGITDGSFTPNLLIDFLNGTINASGGTISGRFNVDYLSLKMKPDAEDMMTGAVAYDCSRIGLPEVAEGMTREFRIHNPQRTRMLSDLEIEPSGTRVRMMFAGSGTERGGSCVIEEGGANSNYTYTLLGIGYSDRTVWHITRTKIENFDGKIHN